MGSIGHNFRASIVPLIRFISPTSNYSVAHKLLDRYPHLPFSHDSIKQCLSEPLWI